MFTPLTTGRLVVRAFTADDTDALYRRRNDPAVARYQSWSLPFPRARADVLAHDAARLEGPTDGEWWMATVAHVDTAEVLGDLVVHLTNGGRTAEVGYTFAAAHWGRGYAVEALSALVAHLFDAFPLTRVFGMLHPDNVASAQVLERIGMLFEGRTRLSYWLGDVNSDDLLYGMTRPEWDQWSGRPRHPPAEVGLVEITPANVWAVRSLRTHHSQTEFVSPVVDSLADALVPEFVNGSPVVPWLRAIEADGQLVGFVMLALPTGAHPEPFLWRLLVDRLHQRRGVASRAMELVEEVCGERGARTLLTSWRRGRGSPEPFHRGLGFEPTGQLIDDGTEIEARKQLGVT